MSRTVRVYGTVRDGTIARGPKGRPSKSRGVPELPSVDNTAQGLATLRAANRQYRISPWPTPYETTTHTLRLCDARDLSWIPDGSVHLVVTSPPYWTLKKYEDRKGQLGEIADYTSFLIELDKV